MLLLKNGVVFDVNRPGFKKASILIEGRRIKKVDEDIHTEGQVNVIDLKGNKVFPGFIDAHSHIGTWVLDHNGNDANECVRPVTPGMRIIDALNPFDRAFSDAVSVGITAAMITPGSGNVIGGQCAIIKTKGTSLKEMLVKFPAAVKMAFGENPKRVYSQMKKSPSSRMATAALVRQTLQKALMYKEYKEKGRINDIDIDMEPFIPVFDGIIPLKIHAHRADDIMTAVGIAEEFGLNFTLDHCTEGHLIVDFLAKRKVPLIIGPPGLFRSKIELKNATLKTPGILAKAGLKVSIISDHPFSNCKYLTWYVGMCVKYGLDYNEGIRSITINPAKALGIDDMVGSLEAGKDADITVYEGDPLDTDSRCLLTVINGNIVYNDYNV